MRTLKISSTNSVTLTLLAISRPLRATLAMPLFNNINIITVNMSVKFNGEHDGVYAREYKQLIQILHIPSDVCYRQPYVVEVGLQAKRTMVKPSQRIYAEGERNTKALRDVDSTVGIQFGLKKLAVERFNFKLLHDYANVDYVNMTIDSEACDFMILSYACHFPWWTPHECLKHVTPREENKECPLTPVMWNAFLKQRLLSHEPYSVDSLCFTQSLGHEKTFAIGAMDHVYRAARKVIVVIEDAAISESEVDAMLHYAETNEPTHRRDDADLKLKFVDEVIVFGLAISYDSERGEDHMPYSVQIYQEPHCSPFIVFAPSCTSEKRYKVRVPRCLIPEAYSWTPRLWILEPLATSPHESRTVRSVPHSWFFDITLNTFIFGYATIRTGRFSIDLFERLQRSSRGKKTFAIPYPPLTQQCSCVYSLKSFCTLQL